MLFARRGGIYLAMACSAPFLRMSCGYAGVSGSWQELNTHKRLIDTYLRADNGNIALTGEIDLAGGKSTFTLALVFGNSANEAGQTARAALLRDFDQISSEYIRGWQEYQARCLDLGKINAGGMPIAWK